MFISQIFIHSISDNNVGCYQCIVIKHCAMVIILVHVYLSNNSVNSFIECTLAGFTVSQNIPTFDFISNAKLFCKQNRPIKSGLKVPKNISYVNDLCLFISLAYSFL